MALGPTDHLTQVVIKGSYDGADYRNVLHFNTNIEVNDANRNALLVALATAMMQCFVVHLLPALPSLFKFSGVSAKQLWPLVTDEVEVVPQAGDDEGGIATDGLPGFASALVALKTGLGGRSKRGRMFLPAPPEAGASAGTLGLDHQAAVVAFLNCLAGKFLVGGTSDYDLCVYSRIGVGTNPPQYQNGTLTPVANMVARRNLAVMRRRKVGTGS